MRQLPQLAQLVKWVVPAFEGNPAGYLAGCSAVQRQLIGCVLTEIESFPEFRSLWDAINRGEFIDSFECFRGVYWRDDSVSRQDSILRSAGVSPTSPLYEECWNSRGFLCRLCDFIAVLSADENGGNFGPRETASFGANQRVVLFETVVVDSRGSTGVSPFPHLE